MFLGVSQLIICLVFPMLHPICMEFLPKSFLSRKMQPLLIASEESHFLLRIFNGSIQTLDSIKDRISQIFNDIFCSKPNRDLVDRRGSEIFPNAIKDMIAANVGDGYELRRAEWWSQKKDCDDEGDGSSAVFNALDEMLKGSLNRLKSMR
ncbi:unnamed protein product [Ilex paraguariensis]